MTKTISPSMDIQVASNFERFLYHVFDGDTVLVGKLMKELVDTGRFEVGEDRVERCRQEFVWER